MEKEKEIDALYEEVQNIEDLLTTEQKVSILKLLELERSEQKKERARKIREGKEKIGARSGRLPLSDFWVSRIRELHGEGISKKEISKVLKVEGKTVSTKTIDKYCRDLKPKEGKADEIIAEKDN